MHELQNNIKIRIRARSVKHFDTFDNIFVFQFLQNFTFMLRFLVNLSILTFTDEFFYNNLTSRCSTFSFHYRGLTTFLKIHIDHSIRFVEIPKLGTIIGAYAILILTGSCNLLQFYVDFVIRNKFKLFHLFSNRFNIYEL